MNIFEQVAEIKAEEARQEAREEEREKSARLLLTNTELSPEKIASLVGVKVSLVKKIQSELKGK